MASYLIKFDKIHLSCTVAVSVSKFIQTFLLFAQILVTVSISNSTEGLLRLHPIHM